MDQRPVERRSDVLVFSTPPMREDLEVIGPVRVVLYAASSAPDTDFTAKLVDVFPDGEARNLTDGILRMRYRDSLEKPQLAVPGQIYELNIENWCRDRAALSEEIRRTVLHEVGHAVGMDHPTLHADGY